MYSSPLLPIENMFQDAENTERARAEIYCAPYTCILKSNAFPIPISTVAMTFVVSGATVKTRCMSSTLHELIGRFTPAVDLSILGLLFVFVPSIWKFCFSFFSLAHPGCILESLFTRRRATEHKHHCSTEGQLISKMASE